ncbi:MAG: hypothetical protein JO337_04535 [Acidimicrobiales bacterium]|nr:hypothetical protein [Acidimicrobiales bacterium]
MNRRLRTAMAASAAALGTAAGLAPALTAGTLQAQAAPALQINQVWSVPIADGNSPIALSSPTVASLDAVPAAVVGDRAGHIYALHLTDGSEVAGWPANTGGVPVDGAPSSLGATVFAGLGSSANNVQPGSGYARFSATGQEQLLTVPMLPSPSQNVGVQNGLAIGTLQGQPAAVGGSMAQLQDAISIGSWTPLGGFPWFQADSNFTTPAVADLYGNGRNEIIEGGDSTAGIAYNQTYSNGGHIRILSDTGNLVCESDTNQVVQSSPAVGEFLGGARVGIVAGTGGFWQPASDTNQLIAMDSHCDRAWETPLDGLTGSSPALVDALGNGQLQVAEGTDRGQGAPGTVWLLNGSNGQPIWQAPALGRIMGGIVSVDLGNGHQDLVVVSASGNSFPGGVQIFDGQTGQVVWQSGADNLSFQNAALVTHDPNGTIGITVAGYKAGGSEVIHYEVANSNGGVVNEAGAWPMFHHDSQLTGSAGTAISCPALGGAANGYLMAEDDGGVYNFGNLPFCGSVEGIGLNRPVVGMASTRDHGGYWLVATDGGIFAFGDAPFYGSTGNLQLVRPVVGMAPTPDGGGYWLIASDGGIFAFGDAPFYGSTGNLPLVRPVVGMASTPSGGGYWMVASDGGIFAFANAPFYGSASSAPLFHSVVAISSI